jgi:hypothetical protein
MNSKANWIEPGAVCAVFIVLSLGGIVWDIASGLLTSGIDGIMLLAVCLMTGGVFTLMLLYVLHQAGLIPAFGKSKAPAGAAKAGAPAGAAAKAASPQPAATTQPSAPSK